MINFYTLVLLLDILNLHVTFITFRPHVVTLQNVLRVTFYLRHFKIENLDYITLHDAEKKTNAWIAAINDLCEDRVLDTIFIIT